MVVTGSYWNLAVLVQGGTEKYIYEVDFHTEGSLGKPTTEKGRGTHILKALIPGKKISVSLQPDVGNVTNPAVRPEPREALSS